MSKDEYDPDDPMEFVGMTFPADAEAETRMAECFVEEFALLGFDRGRLLELFSNPFYAGTHALFVKNGEAWVRETVDRVLSRWTFVRS